MSVATLDHHSLSISWKGRKGGGGRGSEAVDEEEDSSITGYIIKYKNHLDNWEEVKITGRKSSFLLEHLRCGTKYQITVAPFNKVGKADPSPLVTAATAGSGKNQPDIHSFLFIHYSLHDSLAKSVLSPGIYTNISSSFKPTTFARFLPPHFLPYYISFSRSYSSLNEYIYIFGIFDLIHFPLYKIHSKKSFLIFIPPQIASIS